MTTYQRGMNVSIDTDVEQLPFGRYRGCLKIGNELATRLYHCKADHDSPEAAQDDADATIEYAYRRFLAACREH